MLRVCPKKKKKGKKKKKRKEKKRKRKKEIDKRPAEEFRQGFTGAPAAAEGRGNK